MHFYYGFIVTLLFILIVYRNSLLFLKSVSGCEHAKKIKAKLLPQQLGS